MKLFEGIKNDIKNRLPYYKDDWVVGFKNKKVLAATIYIYFTNIIPAITFASYLDEKTEKHLGVIEVILSMAMGGTLFSLFAGQPLVIVGVTGPVAIFCVTIFDFSVRFEVEYLGWLFWISAWTALIHIILAICNASSLVKYVTKFSGEIFGFLIGFIYVYEGSLKFYELFHQQEFSSVASVVASSALLSLLLGIGTFIISMALANARSWTILTKGIRAFLADYGPSLSIVLFTTFQFLPDFKPISLSKLSVPDTFQPTLATRTSWIPAFWATPVWAVFAAILPAIILTLLLFFDHNISSMLSQQPHFHLKKPSSYNWDFCLLGISVFLTGLLGLPPNYGLLPQAPLHVRSLAKIKETREGSKMKETWIGVCETRVSNFGQSVLIAVTLSPPFLYVLSWVPLGVLAGLFLFLGISSFVGNEIAERSLLMISSRQGLDLRAPYAQVSPFTNVKFTLLQLFIVAGIFAVTLTPAAIVFPVLIVLLVPLRKFVLPKLFVSSDLELLDASSPPSVHNDSQSQQEQQVVINGDSSISNTNQNSTEDLELNRLTKGEEYSTSRVNIDVDN